MRDNDPASGRGKQIMNGNPVDSEAWKSAREAFISMYNDKMPLISMIKRLERQMEEAAPDKEKSMRFFYEDTAFEKSAFRRLGCVCAVNQDTGDFAPAMLFFAGKQRKSCPDDVIAALDAVRRELGWGS